MARPYYCLMFESTVYRARRDALLRTLADAAPEGRRGIALFIGNGESPMTYPDNCYDFRQDSSWLYYFGLDLPGLAATLDLDDGSTTLYAGDPDMASLIWTGPVPAATELAAAAGADRASPPDTLAGTIATALSGGRPLRYLPPYREETRAAIARLSGMPAAQVSGRACPDLIRATVALRQIKEDREIAELETAVGISADMHRALLAQARPGWPEYRAAALVQSIAHDHGATLSFRTIATTRGEILHNHSRAQSMRDGGLFLLDAGASSAEYYAGDLTTTFPVNGRFSPRQADLYRILLDMMRAATSILRPGLPFLQAHLAAARTLAQGMRALGIMRGDPDEAVAAGAHALFFPHGLGHMIGLDVHDMEALGEDRVGYGEGFARSAQFGLRSLRLAKPLRPGMVHSVEPGIYFIPALIDLWKSGRRHEAFIDYAALEQWRDSGGMRNEEDWLTTGSGARRLGPAFDKSAEAIERARSGM